MNLSHVDISILQTVAQAFFKSIDMSNL